MSKCLHCGTETTNPKFCSRSCAAKETNKNPKRKLTIKCAHDGCNNLIPKSNSLYCKEHKKRSYQDLTIAEAIYKTHHRSSAYALIRSKARRVMKSEPQICEACGYDKHVEVCHIKAIKEFEETAKLSEVNDKSNLKLLCPNCHWEFDNLMQV